MGVMRRTVAAHFQRRATLRHNVSVRGAIIIKSQTPRTIGCRIVDLSIGGARVKLDEDWPLPDKVLLYESHQENVYECSVRWKEECMVGLSFLDQYTLSNRRALIKEVSHGIAASLRDPDEDSEADTEDTASEEKE